MQVRYDSYTMPNKRGVHAVEMGVADEISRVEFPGNLTEVLIWTACPYQKGVEPAMTTRFFCVCRTDGRGDDTDIGDFKRIKIVGTLPSPYPGMPDSAPSDVLELFKD